jgi:DNA-binding FadR family transcriptional regulator
VGVRLSSSARAAVFAPLDPAGRAESVARRLADAMALGLLHDGEQLPSETELAERFGVAVVTVREALTSLREDGLLLTRRGRGGGSFVQAPSDPATLVLAARVRQLGLPQLVDLADHYAAITGAAAALAARRAGPDDVTRLDELATLLADPADPGQVRRAEIELQAQVAPVFWLAHTTASVRRQAGVRHGEIAAAVRAGDIARARVGAEDHVRDLLLEVRRLRTAGPR